MPIIVTTDQELHVGTPTVIDGISPDQPFAAVFEDDGDTGYFYALDTSAQGKQIKDALHIYNVANVTDQEVPSRVKIGWSTDGTKVVLLINGNPHAVFNFEQKQGYCRTGFPPPAQDGLWSPSGHAWSEQALQLFA